MTILKVIEILANSEESWEDAVQIAVKQASKSVNNIKSVWVQDQSCTVDGEGKIKTFRVTTKITFEIDT